MIAVLFSPTDKDRQPTGDQHEPGTAKAGADHASHTRVRRARSMTKVLIRLFIATA
jgi:hypothetical protein